MPTSHSEGSGFTVKHDSSARVRKLDGAWQEVWLRLEYDKYDSSRLECALIASPIDYREIVVPGMSECHLIVPTPVEHPVRIWGIHGMTTSRAEIVLNAFGVDIGCTDKPVPAGDEVSIIVELSRGRVLHDWGSVIQSYDGTITREGGTGKEIIWEENGETTRASIRYVYEDSSVSNNPAILRIERPTIGRFFKANGTESLKQIMDRTVKDVDDITSLLALCSREPIGWYEISIDTTSNTTGLYPRAKRRRSSIRSDAHSNRLDPLIDHRDLIDGGLKRLLDAYRASRYRDSIARALSFEIGSRDESTIESAYALCYMALEAVVDDLSNQKKRGSLADAVKQVADTWAIRVDDLWPASVGFLNGLREASRLRNDLFHRASASELDLLHKNLVRLQVLVERMILKVLDWPDEKIWRWHDQDVKWVNSTPERENQ